MKVNKGLLWNPGAASINIIIVPSRYGRKGKWRAPERLEWGGGITAAFGAWTCYR